MDRLQLLLEAERRGILPPGQAELLGEARRRGLVPGGTPGTPESARDSSRQVLADANPAEYDQNSPEYQAKYGPGAPSRLERFGHGMLRVGQGVQQRLLQAGDILDRTLGSAGPPQVFDQKSGRYVTDPNFRRGPTSAEYTDRVNEDERLYQQGRGPDAGFDGWSFAGELAATSPLALIGGGTSVGARALTGAKQGAAAGLMQFDPENSVANVARNTGFGSAVGAVVSPIAGKLGDKADDLWSTVAGKLRGLKASAAGADTLESVARQVPEIADLPRNAQATILADAQAQISRTGRLDPAALARKANLLANDVTPTKAMVTRSPRDWTIEENLRRTATSSADPDLAAVGDRLNQLRSANDRALAGRLAGLREGLPDGTAEGHGMSVMRALDDLADRSQDDVSKLYRQVRDVRGGELASDARNLAGALDDLRDVAHAEKLVASVTNRLKRIGMMDANGALTRKTLTVEQAEELRKFVNMLPADFGKRDIIRAIDADVLGGLGDDAFAGARAAARERFAMLDNPATQRALNALGELSQGRTAQSFLKSQVIDAPAQDVTSLVSTLGRLGKDGEQALNSLRAGIVQHLEAKAVNPSSGQVSGAALNRAMREIGEAKLVAVLGPGRMKRLESLARASLDATYSPPYSAVNTSGSGTFLASIADRARVVPGVPLLITDEAAKAARLAGRRSQLAEALRASSSPRLPRSPVTARRLAEAMRRLTGPGAALAVQEAQQQ